MTKWALFGYINNRYTLWEGIGLSGQTLIKSWTIVFSRKYNYYAIHAHTTKKDPVCLRMMWLA